MGAPLYDYAVRFPRMAKQPGSRISGTALFTEGMDTNPFAFDLYTEMAWHTEPVNLPSWTHKWAERRYGAVDPHADRAWQILLQTAYSYRADGDKNHGERDSSQESLFNSQPSLTATRASSWSPDVLRYNADDLKPALTELLEVAPALRSTATYQYDLVDVARQVMSNESRAMLPQIKAAYETRDKAAFAKLTAEWLHRMQLQNDLLQTNESFLLGRWLSYVPPWASSPAELARLNYDARSILTTWGDRHASETGSTRVRQPRLGRPNQRLLPAALEAVLRHAFEVARNRKSTRKDRLVRRRRSLESHPQILQRSGARRPVRRRAGHRTGPWAILEVLTAARSPCCRETPPLNSTSAVLQAPHTTSESTRPSRLLSLDLLRGLTIGFMILVNDNGDGNRAYWALKHADWNGFTPTDLVFPTFLFLVGISTVLSLSSRVAQGIAKGKLYAHVLRRTVILFLLGLVVNSFPFFHLHTMRFYGVLPRIAICYLVVATLYLISPGWRSKAALAVAALVGYWLLMRFVPVPGYGVPTHEVPLLDRDGNLAAWVDRQIFSPSHLYEHTRDPEGLLSTLPALATALIGMLTALWLRSSHSLTQKIRGIAAAGLSAVLLAGLWNFTFPINKKLWTSSYVLFAGGLSLLLLALSMGLVDLPSEAEPKPERSRRSHFFTPLLVFGTNAIAAYVLSELLAATLYSIHPSFHVTLQQILYRSILSVVPNAPFASLLYSLAYVAVCWIPIYVLYRRKIFLKI